LAVHVCIWVYNLVARDLAVKCSFLNLRLEQTHRRATRGFHYKMHVILQRFSYTILEADCLVVTRRITQLSRLVCSFYDLRGFWFSRPGQIYSGL
jgi:hypothetical protein